MVELGERTARVTRQMLTNWVETRADPDATNLSAVQSCGQAVPRAVDAIDTRHVQSEGRAQSFLGWFPTR